MEILEGLLRTHPSAGDDVAALLEVAALLGLADRSDEAELLVAQARSLDELHGIPWASCTVLRNDLARFRCRQGACCTGVRSTD